MRRIAIYVIALLAAVLVATQLFLPSYLERRVERQLTRQGGTARVELSAAPALRLIAGEGDRIRARGSGLVLDLLTPGSGVMKGLDGFGAVDAQFTDGRVGPLRIAHAGVERSGQAPYHVTIAASGSAADLSAFAGGQLGGNLGSVLGGLAGGVLGLGAQSVPVNVDALVRSDGGRPVVETVRGTIAGLPAGPLMEALAGALAARL